MIDHMPDAAQSVKVTPITMQDVRLMAGEGKLFPADVLNAVNVILKQRAERPVHRSSAATEHAKVADWLDDQAIIATNSLHCGDNSAMIHQTHDWAEKLEAAARHLRAVPQGVPK